MFILDLDWWNVVDWWRYRITHTTRRIERRGASYMWYMHAMEANCVADSVLNDCNLYDDGCLRWLIISSLSFGVMFVMSVV